MKEQILRNVETRKSEYSLPLKKIYAVLAFSPVMICVLVIHLDHHNKTNLIFTAKVPQGTKIQSSEKISYFSDPQDTLDSIPVHPATVYTRHLPLGTIMCEAKQESHISRYRNMKVKPESDNTAL